MRCWIGSPDSYDASAALPARTDPHVHRRAADAAAGSRSMDWKWSGEQSNLKTEAADLQQAREGSKKGVQLLQSVNASIQ
jgi:hypothetical protein